MLIFLGIILVSLVAVANGLGLLAWLLWIAAAIWGVLCGALAMAGTLADFLRWLKDC